MIIPAARKALRLLFRRRGALFERGWFRSVRTGLAVDRLGEPLPWYCYSAIQFLQPRLRNDMRVFEYGAGYSTLWYASRVREIVSVDHNKKWIGALQEGVSALPVTLLHQDDPEGYERSIAEFGQFDVVVVDGISRTNCYRACQANLKSEGVIIWDNSNREEFQRMLPEFKADGFKVIELSGIGPINTYEWSTAFLYRKDNCLGL